ncbi:hypothetical protein P886_1181 [Alteromonadaceae bacterium 2753L.S.0a.02]|nr:hypothetical protein P886_1181 [Alteromonadaceae bacterium 2753L.S.0a.02]
MKKYISFFLLFLPKIAFASNFGDLPSVLPFFWLAIVISIFWAVAKAMKPVENSDKKKFEFAAYFLYQTLGIVLSFILIVVLWLITL